MIQMNNRHYILVFLAACMLLMTSCLSDDETTVTYYDDAAITSFSLGTLSRTLHTTNAAGKDSTYTTTVDCSTYAFVINQQLGIIYNIDSLPEGTQTAKSLVNVTAKNSGYVYLKHNDGTDSLKMVQNTDSLDFSTPRVLRCYANDGSWYREYTVEVRVHNEKDSTFYWNEKKASEAIARLEDMRGMAFKNSIVAYGIAGGKAVAVATDQNDGNNWRNLTLPEAGRISITTTADVAYLLTDNGNVFTSTDLNTWTQTAAMTGLKQLVAASKTEVYAIADNGTLQKSTDNGASWSADDIDSPAAFLPNADISGFAVPTKTNSDIEKIYLFGNRYDNGTVTCNIWTKTVDSSDHALRLPWMYQPFGTDTWHHAPTVDHLTVIPYADRLLLMGGEGVGECTLKAFEHTYHSMDNGLNWWQTEIITLPEGFSSSPTSFAMVADNNRHVWLMCGSTGKVWRGYLSNVAWQ